MAIFSFRMYLFILLLSVIHMTAMAPPADSSVHRPQAQTLTSNRASSSNRGLYGLACTSMGTDCLRSPTRR